MKEAVFELSKDTVGDMRCLRSLQEEMQIKRYIQTCDYRAVECVMKRLEPDFSGRHPANPFTHAVYTAVESITLITRYCIDAGMAESRAFALSDVCLQQLELCFNRDDVHSSVRCSVERFLGEMVRCKTKRVIKENYSNYVKFAVNYVISNLNTQLTLGDISKALFLNANYLAQIFHTETGMTFSRFVRKQKIEAAKELLQFTDYSASAISQQLAFSGQSYFIKVFNAETGMTPKEYRAMLAEKSNN
ncbi:AraC family transcriptional regulator [Ruminococcaceae bacterium OttesenSCG-928-L11]|nr:AraC family transcriptional regulator [Ruminococcaceae bacterium OttesenSCG-928-L11]